MNRKIQIIFFLLSLSLAASVKINLGENRPPALKMLKGSIVSNQLSTIPHFKVYYQGTQTISNDDGFFTIQITKQNTDYSLLICKDFKPTFDSVNTIKNLVFNTKITMEKIFEFLWNVSQDFQKVSNHRDYIYLLDGLKSKRAF